AQHSHLHTFPTRRSSDLKLEMLDDSQQELEAAQQEQRARVSQERESLGGLQRELSGLEKQLQTDLGRRASLEALQQAALEKETPETRQWLQRMGLDLQARLGARIRVESGWERALEAVLGEHLQA